eukprot:CAMPEP_0114560322 /NCGR_PEP_ID=MMETSP0114-20121206/11397_1 /TAXON_ID=31324 /ORGANISM="Goniomonas sp, Strain m" /LENGTH=161 /DNA_ID=CAMNT_0001745859 /DNA_START=37 /DNA_END=519 /DNA_ORIENTATION=-
MTYQDDGEFTTFSFGSTIGGGDDGDVWYLRQKIIEDKLRTAAWKSQEQEELTKFRSAASRASADVGICLTQKKRTGEGQKKQSALLGNIVRVVKAGESTGTAPKDGKRPCPDGDGEAASKGKKAKESAAEEKKQEEEAKSGESSDDGGGLLGLGDYGSDSD